MTHGRGQPDVAVIEGGAIGAATALELSRAGARVVVLEAGPRLAAGCSYGYHRACPSAKSSPRKWSRRV